MLVYLQYTKLTFYLVSSVLILTHMLLHRLLIVICSNNVLYFDTMDQWTLRALRIVLLIHSERYLLFVIALPTHLSILHIVLDHIQNFLSIGDPQNLEFNITELD